MQRFLHTNDDGSVSEVGHPGWMSGEEGPDRLLTPDELFDAGYGTPIIDAPPDHNPESQVLTVNPIEEWVKGERSITKTYTVVDLTKQQIREAMTTLTPRQLRLALLSIGVHEADVDAKLTNDPAGAIEWKYASAYKRTHPLIDGLGVLFSLTPEQIDSLWHWAQEL